VFDLSIATARGVIECIRKESTHLSASTYVLVVELISNSLRTNPIAGTYDVTPFVAALITLYQTS